MGFSPATCQGIFGRSTAIRAIPGSHRLRQRQTASESRSRSSCQQWIRSALLPLRHVGRLLCLECTMGLEFLYLRGQGPERLYHLRLRSPRPLIPLSLPLQLTPRVLPSSVSSSRLRCGDYSQCWLKVHGSHGWHECAAGSVRVSCQLFWSRKPGSRTG